MRECADRRLTLGLGSTTTTLNPALDTLSATASPAGPVPAITRSKFCLEAGSYRGRSMSSNSFASRGSVSGAGSGGKSRTAALT